MTPQEAIRGAKRGELLPLYLVCGEERLLRDEVIDALRTASLGAGIADFNEDKLTAGEVDADRVISAARTVPMMAPRRFVLVRNLDRWDSASDDGGGRSAKDDRLPPLDKLAAYAEEPIDTTCLVLVAQKLDGRRKLSAIGKKKGFVVNCDALAPRDLGPWIRGRAESQGHAMSHDVSELLAEIAGPELGHLADAVERLGLYVGEGAEIDEDAVAACVARVRLADTWALVDAVGARDLGRALSMLADAYDPRDRGLPLLGALAWSVRQLAKFELAIAEGASMDEAARRAGIYPAFRAREVQQKLRAFRPRELERWLLVLAETDLALKSSRRGADAILEDMLTRLCRRAA